MVLCKRQENERNVPMRVLRAADLVRACPNGRGDFSVPLVPPRSLHTSASVDSYDCSFRALHASFTPPSGFVVTTPLATSSLSRVYCGPMRGLI
jgi:hypothetical protein